ncbi:serine/threonine protein phosphatase 2A 59 kDa regulatory subunit B eta, partial [Trifolium medium]|nr:serine/threonine protein phosphatase 2A 59 kDa regulatory subunit B eta [Trifolium medium]
KIFHDLDPDLYKECLQKFEQDESKEEEVTAGREATWKRLEEVAAKKAASNEAVLISKALPRKSAGIEGYLLLVADNLIFTTTSKA